jgi:hypothetical protein
MAAVARHATITPVPGGKGRWSGLSGPQCGGLEPADAATRSRVPSSHQRPDSHALGDRWTSRPWLPWK